MNNEFQDLEHPETPMLCSVFRELNKTGALPIDQVGHILSIEDPYPYMGHRDMKYSRVRTVFHGCRSIDAQRAILNNLTEGSGWLHKHVDTKHDANGDGVVDTTDVLEGALKANKELGRLLLATVEEHKRGMRSIGGNRATELNQSINSVIEHLLQAQQVVCFLSQFKSSRRSA